MSVYVCLFVCCYVSLSLCLWLRQRIFSQRPAEAPPPYKRMLERTLGRTRKTSGRTHLHIGLLYVLLLKLPISAPWTYIRLMVRATMRGGSVVSSEPCVRWVASSNPTLVATYRDLGQILHSQLPVALRRQN